MKAGRIKQILQEALDILEDCDDNTDIRLESNTYFCNGASAFLGISSTGFLPLGDKLYDYIEDIDYEELDENINEKFERIYQKSLK
jgi:transcription initiation factor IIE alpha subunit